MSRVRKGVCPFLTRRLAHGLHLWRRHPGLSEKHPGGDDRHGVRGGEGGGGEGMSVCPCFLCFLHFIKGDELARVCRKKFPQFVFSMLYFLSSVSGFSIR